MKRLLFIIFAGVLATGCNQDTVGPTSDPTKLELSKTSVNIGFAGGKASVDLTHNYAWESSVSSGSEWLSFDVGNSSGGITPIIIEAKPNESKLERSSTITFRSKELEQVLTITQNTLIAEVSPSELSFKFTGGTEHLIFTTTVPEWSFSVTSEAEEWCTVEKEGENGIAVTAQPNHTDTNRSATITITAGTLERKAIVTQDRFIFETSPSSLEFEAAGGTRSMTITTNAGEWTWSVQPEEDWLLVEKAGDNELSVTTTGNNEVRQGRAATITINADSFSKNISVTQYATGAYEDKEVVRLQSATIGSGVNIVLMGDGYIASDMSIGGGLYERDMRAAMEHFFSVYPYSDYREYFNVWMVGAISKESGATTLSPRVNVDTVFDSVLDGGNSTGINCNSGTVESYTRLVANTVGKPLAEMTVIMPINLYVYAGTCFMSSNGFSISMCPVGPTYQSIVVHEAGGHGFGKLADEYRYYSRQYPDKADTQQWQRWGHFLNVDFSSDIRQTLWRGFADRPGYDMVDTWEGADLYDYGIWRCEYNSRMNDNVLYFNAQSRYVQIGRIYEWADLEYSFEQFLEDDIIPPYPANARTRGEGVLAPFVPLAPPILVEAASDGL